MLYLFHSVNMTLNQAVGFFWVSMLIFIKGGNKIILGKSFKLDSMCYANWSPPGLTTPKGETVKQEREPPSAESRR